LPSPESTNVGEDDGSWETVQSKKKRGKGDSPWQTQKDASTFSSRVCQKNMLNADPVTGRGNTMTPNRSMHPQIAKKPSGASRFPGAHQDELLTYRISGLDPDVTEEDVRDFLDGRFSHTTVKQGKSPIHYVSLAALSDTQQVAIVELSQKPKDFCPRNHSGTRTIFPEQSRFNTEIYIDSNFNGVTPLRAPLSHSPAESLSQVNVE
jgi:RNA recognition motif-containing protein